MSGTKRKVSGAGNFWGYTCPDAKRRIVLTYEWSTLNSWNGKVIRMHSHCKGVPVEQIFHLQWIRMTKIQVGWSLSCVAWDAADNGTGTDLSLPSNSSGATQIYWLFCIVTVKTEIFLKFLYFLRFIDGGYRWVTAAAAGRTRNARNIKTCDEDLQLSW